MGEVAVEAEPMRYDGPAAHVGKATTVPWLLPVRVNELSSEIEVVKPFRLSETARVQIGVPVGVQLVVL